MELRNKLERSGRDPNSETMTDAKKGGKKRGRKPKNTKKVDKPPPKKRGRKPKGGKIIKNLADMSQN